MKVDGCGAAFDLWAWPLFCHDECPHQRYLVTLPVVCPCLLAMFPVLQPGSKWAHFTRLSTPNGPRSLLEKRVFHPSLTHFWFQNGPFSRLFGTLEGPKWLKMGSKWALLTCLFTPTAPRSFLEKGVFDPFLTHFWSQNVPFSRHFGTLGGPRWATTSSKRAKTTCFGIPRGLESFLEKIFFFPPGGPR